MRMVRCVSFWSRILKPGSRKLSAATRERRVPVRRTDWPPETDQMLGVIEVICGVLSWS